MKDKLLFKRKRVNWNRVLVILGLEDYFLLDDDYKKIKSLNKKCFNWFLSRFGRQYVRLVRENPKYFMDEQFMSDVIQFKYSHPSARDIDEISKIAKIKWIKEVDE